MDRFSAAKLQSGETNKKPRENRAPDIDVRGQQIRDPDVQPENPHLLTRRSVLVGGAALMAAEAAESKQLNPLINLLGKPLGELDYHAEVNKFKDALEREYGIKLIMGPQPGQKRVTGDVMLLEKYKSVMEVIAQELSFYPPEMIRNIGRGQPFEIRVMDSLYLKGPFTGLQSSGERISITAHAQPIAEDGMARLSLNVSESQDLQRRSIHHELNHFFTANWENWDRRNEKWTAFHKKISPNPYAQVPPETTTDTPAPPDT